MTKFTISACAAAALSVFAVVPASAQETSVAVPIADIDMNSPTGVEKLSQRLEAGIRTVCERPDTMRDLKSMADWQSCRDKAMNAANAQLSDAGVEPVGAN